MDSYSDTIAFNHTHAIYQDNSLRLYDGRLGARGEGVGQTALATVLTVIMESHLQRDKIE